jgi:hypothetical protein
VALKNKFTFTEIKSIIHTVYDDILNKSNTNNTTIQGIQNEFKFTKEEVQFNGQVD